jgi:hypothetical protein
MNIMKLLMILSAILVISCNSGKNADEKNSTQNSADNKTKGNKWTNEDQVNFMNDCITEAAKGMKGDSAQIYCACMLTKAQAAYPEFEDVSKKMTVNQIDKWAADCLGK